MKSTVLNFELKHWVKQPLFYFLSFGFYAFSLVTMLGTGGYFDDPSTTSELQSTLNSPFALSFIGFLLVKLMLFAFGVFGGIGIQRDFSSRIFGILYTYPVRKTNYLGGKLLSALFPVLILVLLTYSGLLTGELMLGTDSTKIGAFDFFGYFIGVCFYMLPTAIAISVFVFVSVGITRNIYAGFATVIFFILFQLILENTLFQYPNVLALLDPFGENAFIQATADWSIADKNSTMLPIGTMAVANRVFWLIATLLLFGWFVRKFNFQYSPFSLFGKMSFRKRKMTRKASGSYTVQSSTRKTSVFSFNSFSQLKQLTRVEFVSILKNKIFILLTFLACLLAFLIQLKVTNTGTFNFAPKTRIILGLPLSVFVQIVVFCTFLTSGTVVKRARRVNVAALEDSTAVTSSNVFFSKTIAIVLTIVMQLVIFTLASILLQLFNGQASVEIGLYAIHVFGLILPILICWSIFSQFVHVLIPNLYMSLGVLLACWLGVQSIEHLGVSTSVLKLYNLPVLVYSDLSGFSQLGSYLWLMLYWVLFSVILALLTFLLWIRSSELSLISRWSIFRKRMTRARSFVFTILVVNFSWLGVSIYSNERGEAHYSNDLLDANLAQYESVWECYALLDQPKISNVDLVLDIYPDEKRFSAIGEYFLVNKEQAPIDTVFVRTSYDELTTIDWQGKAKLILSDSLFHSYLYSLDEPLLPGDSVSLHFTVESNENTLFYRNSSVLSSGTYLKQDFLPRIGYQFVEHEQEVDKEHGHRHNYFHRDADLVKIRTTITTQSNQYGIGPGELLSKKENGNRATFVYETPKPVKFNFSFHSGDFQFKSTKYEEVEIQAYFAADHGENVEMMIDGLKAAAEFNTQLFGTYPYETVRIVEFPHTEESFSATLTSNNIPTSELMFCINQKAMGGDVQLPFYVLAHELTHEWFGNQLIPADNAGAKMLTESITEYITLCIYEEHFGEKKAKEFLEVQYERFREGRKVEKGEESTLADVLTHQEYISYGKGAIAFHEISEAIGRKKFNTLLALFLKLWDANAGKYPTTYDFINFLKDNSGDQYHKLIDRWFLEIHPI